MTERKKFKELVRTRMAKTGESYTSARRQLLAKRDDGAASAAVRNGSGVEAAAYAGVHSATAAARILLRHSGLDLDESTLLAVGGGLGMGVFSFHYEEFSSFFIAGRHLWHDDLQFLQGLAERLDLPLDVQETGSKAKALGNLREMLAGGPVIAFVDLAALGHRGPVDAYYVVTVLSLDEENGVATIADLAEEPVEVSLEALSAARARHGKFRNRLVRFGEPEGERDLEKALRSGLQACVDGFANPAMKNYNRNFTLEALATLARRMRGSDRNSWQQVFPPGPRLAGALASLYEYVEHYGTGGGLLRPFYAEALTGAAKVMGEDLTEAVQAYREAGRAWSELARAALPESVTEFVELRKLMDDGYAHYYAEGGKATERVLQLAGRRRELQSSPFPLDGRAAEELVRGLAERVDAVHELERAALAKLEGALR